MDFQDPPVFCYRTYGLMGSGLILSSPKELSANCSMLSLQGNSNVPQKMCTSGLCLLFSNRTNGLMDSGLMLSAPKRMRATLQYDSIVWSVNKETSLHYNPTLAGIFGQQEFLTFLTFPHNIREMSHLHWPALFLTTAHDLFDLIPKFPCFSFTATRDWCYRYSFSNAGLRSSTTDLGDGTVMHVWAPKAHIQSKPTLVLIHGIGANAMWQWNDFVSPLMSRFNVYVPDLLFFGESYTTRPERSEQFQAQCVMRVMDAYGVTVMSVVGISYGGFVGYSMAAQFKERLDKLVLCCAGVCLEEKDMEKGMFKVKSVDEAISMLLAQTPDKMRELMKISFHKPTKGIPSCFLNDFIH
ncbi:Alpha/beta hydrolase fold-1 - like 10, partial [Theobroma cacao]